MTQELMVEKKNIEVVKSYEFWTKIPIQSYPQLWISFFLTKNYMIPPKKSQILENDVCNVKLKMAILCRVLKYMF